MVIFVRFILCFFLFIYFFYILSSFTVGRGMLCFSRCHRLSQSCVRESFHLYVCSFLAIFFSLFRLFVCLCVPHTYADTQRVCWRIPNPYEIETLDSNSHPHKRAHRTEAHRVQRRVVDGHWSRTRTHYTFAKCIFIFFFFVGPSLALWTRARVCKFHWMFGRRIKPKQKICSSIFGRKGRRRRRTTRRKGREWERKIK